MGQQSRVRIVGESVLSGMEALAVAVAGPVLPRLSFEEMLARIFALSHPATVGQVAVAFDVFQQTWHVFPAGVVPFEEDPICILTPDAPTFPRASFTDALANEGLPAVSARAVVAERKPFFTLSDLAGRVGFAPWLLVDQTSRQIRLFGDAEIVTTGRRFAVQRVQNYFYEGPLP